jgi:hypothetical protein
MLGRSLVLGAGALGALVFVVLAQSQSSEKVPQSEMKKQFQAMAEKAGATADAHKLLAPLVGAFDQRIEVRMGSGEPMSSHCLSHGEWLMGGRYVKSESRPAPDEELKGERLIVYGYDTRSCKYTMWGIDSMSTFAVSATGDYDADARTFTLEGERYGSGPAKVPFRWVVRLQEGGGFTQEILMKPPQGEEWVPVVVVKNTPKDH